MAYFRCLNTCLYPPGHTTCTSQGSEWLLYLISSSGRGQEPRLKTWQLIWWKLWNYAIWSIWLCEFTPPIIPNLGWTWRWIQTGWMIMALATQDCVDSNSSGWTIALLAAVRLRSTIRSWGSPSGCPSHRQTGGDGLNSNPNRQKPMKPDQHMSYVIWL